MSYPPCQDCKKITGSRTAKRCWACHRKRIWKGGTHINHWGYVRYNPGVKSHGGQFVHRVVMEKKLGRKLVEGEFVHHINHIKTDNRPENLQLINTFDHNHIHRPDLKNIRHPVYGYYIKKGRNPETYTRPALPRDPVTGRYLPRK